MVVQLVVLLPCSKKILTKSQAEVFLHGFYMFSLWIHGFSPGTPASSYSPIKDLHACMFGCPVMQVKMKVRNLLFSLSPVLKLLHRSSMYTVISFLFKALQKKNSSSHVSSVTTT
ncbi:hypothetical protein ILYODFUR_014682 [Ilyodon furcidens]|uniref:Uncharacterized protein n=1 Tax=Ilyodon furcidens TaxID=33524 RepID=A0ABV0TBV9_9TELE